MRFCHCITNTIQLDNVMSIFRNTFSPTIKTQLEKSDPTLKTSVESELVKTLKSIELLEDKLRKSEKKKLEAANKAIAQALAKK